MSENVHARNLWKGTAAEQAALTPSDSLAYFVVTDTVPNQLWIWDGAAWEQIGGTASAPLDATYLTLSLNATLTNERVFTEGPGVDLVDAGAGATLTIGVGGDSILLYSASLVPAVEYAASAAGLAAAVAAAVAGDTIVIPSTTIAGDVTVPAGVTVAGMGYNSYLSGANVDIDASNAYLANARLGSYYYVFGQATNSAPNTPYLVTAPGLGLTGFGINSLPKTGFDLSVGNVNIETTSARKTTISGPHIRLYSDFADGAQDEIVWYENTNARWSWQMGEHPTHDTTIRFWRETYNNYFYFDGAAVIFGAKQNGAAGIALNANLAAGDFTLSISPANLTGNRIHTLPDYSVTWPAADAAGYLTSNGAGALSWSATATATAHAMLSATHSDTTSAAVVRGDLITGQGASPTWTRLAKGTANAILTGDGTDTFWSTYLLTGTAGGTINFAVTNTKTLTLTAADNYNLTVPATGTAALLGTANIFTANQTISNTAPSLALTDTTASAKSLTIAVDSNFADVRESAGAAGSLLRLDLTNSRVAIGTGALGPAYRLTLDQGNSVAVNTGLSIQNTISTGPTVQDYGHLWVSDVNVFAIQSGDESAYRTLALNPLGGNVGIADSAPAEKLDVTGNINATGVYKIDDVQVISNRVIDARADDVISDVTWSATEAGVLDAVRDCLITHGLLAAA